MKPCQIVLAVFKHYKTDETHIFSVCKLQNDYDKFRILKQNIENNEWHISYNGLAFDAQITHNIIKHHDNLILMDGESIAKEIYEYAQEAIKRSNNKEFQTFPEWEMSIKQIDVYKLNHWDNMAKRSSLKWIQYSMDWDNMVDMPLPHDTNITTKQQLDMIVSYCINDVDSTKEIFNQCKPLIALRKSLTDQYGINLYSASEPRISKELFAYYLGKELGIPKYELKKLRTYRNVIKVKDIILDYIEFVTPEFNNLLDKFKTVEINPNLLRVDLSIQLFIKKSKQILVWVVHMVVTNRVYMNQMKIILLCLQMLLVSILTLQLKIRLHLHI